MKVVVDTHVFVSSFFGGYPRKVIDRWETGEISLCLSGAILDEYIAVLQRMGLSGERELEELLILFQSGRNCLFAAKTPKLKVCADPDDDKFVEAAVALGAKVVVSGDKELLAAKEYMGIEILKPREFVEKRASVT